MSSAASDAKRKRTGGPRALANTTRQAMSCRVVFGWRYLPNVWNDIDYVA